MKNKTNKKYLNAIPLDDYEKELSEFLEKEEFVHNPNIEETREMFAQAAKRHIELRESKSITIRVKNEDLIKAKVRAKKSQVPYQTIINLLIRKYGRGEIDIVI